MAELKFQRAHGPNVPPGIGDGQSQKAIVAVIDVGQGLGAGDVIKGPVLQRGSTLLSAKLVVGADEDVTAPAITADVAIGEVEIATGAAPAPGASVIADFEPYTLPGNESVDVTISGAVAATDGVRLYLVLEFLPVNS